MQLHNRELNSNQRILSAAEYARLEMLGNQLIEVIRQYRLSLDKDEIFEVRKEIRLRMKALQAEIDLLEGADARSIN